MWLEERRQQQHQRIHCTTLGPLQTRLRACARLPALCLSNILAAKKAALPRVPRQRHSSLLASPPAAARGEARAGSTATCPTQRACIVQALTPAPPVGGSDQHPPCLHGMVLCTALLLHPAHEGVQVLDVQGSETYGEGCLRAEKSGINHGSRAWPLPCCLPGGQHGAWSWDETGIPNC